MVSGKGTTLQNLIDEIAGGRLRAEIRLVISSKLRAFGLERAVRAGLKATVLKPREFEDPASYGRAIERAASEAGAKLICMAGFLAYWKIPDAWKGRVLNIHPALLPAFGGKGMHGDRVHEAVLERGCKVSGCTVHVADDEYDHGPIVLQRTVPVRDDDTVDLLRARVFHEECLAYPQAIRLFAEGRVAFVGRRVRIIAPREG
jgi:formyltetrahydrofolate-dependent phosphoribosylglycinamide formyltransferase